MSQPNPYDFLRVTPDVTLAALKKRYRELAFALHPDRNPASDAAEQFARVSVAYEFLLKKIEGGDPAIKAVSKTAKRGSTPRPPAKTKCSVCRGTGREKIQKGFYVATRKCVSCS